MFRISHPTHHTSVDVASVLEITSAVYALPTGQYVVYKISDDFDPLMRGAERQGTATKLPNGSVRIDCDAKRIQGART
jgi:hypothetical protein